MYWTVKIKGYTPKHTAPEQSLGVKKYAGKNSIFLCQGYVWTSQKYMS